MYGKDAVVRDTTFTTGPNRKLNCYEGSLTVSARPSGERRLQATQSVGIGASKVVKSGLQEYKAGCSVAKF